MTIGEKDTLVNPKNLPSRNLMFQIVNPRDVGRMLKRTPEISYYSDRHRTEASDRPLEKLDR